MKKYNVKCWRKREKYWEYLGQYFSKSEKQIEDLHSRLEAKYNSLISFEKEEVEAK